MSVSITAALLASRAFGRIRWLGSPLDVHVRQALMVGAVGAPHELARLLRRRLPGTTSPNLARDIEVVLDQCAYDPLELAIHAADGPPHVIGHLVPHELFGRANDWPTVTLAHQNLRLADAHLHSGASMGLSVFLRALGNATESTPVSLYEVGAFDEIGEQYSIGAVVGGLRHFLRLIHAERTGRRVETPPSVAEAWASGDFWSHVRNVAAAVTLPTESRPLGAMIDLCTVPVVGGGTFFWNPADEARDYIAQVRANGTTRQRKLCTGFVGAAFLLNGFLRSAPGEGLPSFVDRFEQMGLLRDSAISAERAEAVQIALDFILQDDRVIGAEFRKSVFAGRDSTIPNLQDSISRSLADHLEGFAQSDAVRHLPRNLSMPVTFLRGHKTMTQEEVSLIYDLAPLWKLAMAIENVASRDIAGRYITAVDVVGNELAMPNWVFIPLLAYLGRRDDEGARLNISISCHAGETFTTRLQGIRSVGELITPTRFVDRIGHALALDRMTSDFIVGDAQHEVAARDVIEDMCWLISANIYSDDAQTLLDRVIGALGLLSFGITPETLVEASVDRCSIAGYSKNGLCTQISHPPMGVVPLNARFARGSSLAFLLLTHHGSAFPFNVLDRPLPQPIVDQYLQHDADLSEPVAARIREILISERIVIEACPSSNMRLSGLPKVSYLPIERWLREGLRLSLNSDDPLIFGNSVAGEAALIEANCPQWVLPQLARTSEEACGAGRSPSGDTSYAIAAQIARASTNTA